MKEILNKRKQELGNQKWVNIGDIEKEKTKQYILEKEQREKEKQEKLKKEAEEILEYCNTFKKVHSGTLARNQIDKLLDTANSKEESAETNKCSLIKNDNDKIDDQNKIPPVAKGEVIKQLRSLGLPVTLFGETDWMRYQRLFKSKEENLDSEIKREGNTFHNDVKLDEEEFNHQKGLKELHDEEIEEKKFQERVAKSRQLLDLSSLECRGRKKISLGETIPQDIKCDDVYNWCQKGLKEWEKDIRV